MTISRRSLLASASLAAIVPNPRARAQTPRPLRIGVLSDFSGSFRTDSGPVSLAAVQQAVQDFGSAAGGMMIDVVSADHQNKPDIAVGLVREWFDRSGVDAVVDCVGSAVALAVAGVARDRNKACIVTGAGTADLTGKQCSPNTIHFAYDTWMLAKSTGDALVRSGGDTWYFISADYAFGAALERDTSGFVTAAGGKVLGSSKHPFPGNTDFSSYLIAAQSSGAKVLGIANAGADTVNTIKQAVEFGLTTHGMRMAALVMVITGIHPLGLEVAQGLNFTETFYWDLNDRTRALTQRMAPKIGSDVRMNMLQAGSYGATLHLLKAAAALSPTDRTSGLALVDRMKAIPTDDDAFGPGRIRQDGRALHPAYLLQVKSPAESKGPWDYCRVVATTPAEEAFRPLDQGGCAFIHN
jgi:branched-chain amino acid transport system substrate-binding protein